VLIQNATENLSAALHLFSIGFRKRSLVKRQTYHFNMFALAEQALSQLVLLKSAQAVK